MANTKLAVYTAIFGNYDAFKSRPPRGDYDFFLFTDHAPQPPLSFGTTVQCRLPGYTPVRNARLVKCRPHIFLPGYDRTLWIDGSIAITNVPKMLKFAMGIATDIMVPAHRHRTCIYQEAEECIQIKCDAAAVITDQVARYKAEGYPCKAGLSETGILTRVNNPKTRMVNELWWQEIASGSHRDQLSFDYCVRKAGATIQRTAMNVDNCTWARRSKHIGSRIMAGAANKTSLGKSPF